MKNQLIENGELYEKFGINPQIFSLLMTTGVDQEGKLQIQWGEQKIRQNRYFTICKLLKEGTEKGLFNYFQVLINSIQITNLTERIHVV